MEGSELRKFREGLGITQDELAKALSVATNTVARWERSERKIPNHLPLSLKTIVEEREKNEKSESK